MIKQQRLEELIREKIPLGSPDSRGFYSHKCLVCNDYKVRAGFKFDSGKTVGFNCWNCGATALYEEFSGQISKKFRRILESYGIEDSEISNVVNTAFFFKKPEETKLTLKSLVKVNTQTLPVKLPPNTFKLASTIEHVDMQSKIISYLDERCVDLNRHTFFFSTEERFKDRVIIPFYRNGALIYWQARSINSHEKKRYDNCIVSRDAVMFNMDKLNSFGSLPLFVSEGVFDAMMFDGLATLGSKFTDAKLELLGQSRRRLVFVIDKDKNGRGLAESVLAAGWEITFAPDGADDLNKSVQRFGRSYTAMHLMKNIPRDKDTARLALELNCK